MRTVQPPEGWEGEAFTGDGAGDQLRQRRCRLDGMGVDEAKRAIIDWLEEQGAGRGAVNFRLRDWLLSRQRYWGAPIPIIHCPTAARCRSPRTSCPSCCRELRGAT